MKVTISHTAKHRTRGSTLTAACRASYDRYTLGLPSRAERQLDPDLRYATTLGAADETQASCRLAVATHVMA